MWGRRSGAGGRIVLRLVWGRQARFGLLVTTLAIGGCAQSGSWQNSDVPEEQWSADRADCQRRARDQAEREFALSQQGTRSLNYDLGGQWQTDMNRFSGQRRQQQLFEILHDATRLSPRTDRRVGRSPPKLDVAASRGRACPTSVAAADASRIDAAVWSTRSRRSAMARLQLGARRLARDGGQNGIDHLRLFADKPIQKGR